MCLADPVDQMGGWSEPVQSWRMEEAIPLLFSIRMPFFRAFLLLS